MKNYLAFEKRFGPLAFLICLDPHESVMIQKASFGITEQLDQCDLLYIWDVAFCLDTEPLVRWLEASPHHVIHLIEPHIARWKGWLEMIEQESLINHPRFFAHGMMGHLTIDNLAASFASAYPSFHPFYHGDPANSDFALFKSEMQQSLLIYRNALARHVMWEPLWNSMMSKRALFKRAGNALDLKGKWRGKPGFICGAGPSLSGAAPFLKEMEGRAILIGAGTGAATMDALGIYPDFACFCDGTDLQYRKVSHFERKKIPIIYTPHVYPGVIHASGGGGLLFPLAANQIESFLWGEHAEMADVWLCKDPQALSVTSLALSIAWHAGCDPIFLAGVDLSYLDARRYACFKEDSSMHDLIAVDERRLTSSQWLLEKKAIEHFIANHPATWINLSEGLPIAGCFSAGSALDYPLIDKENLYPKDSFSPWDDHKMDLLGQSAQRVLQIVEKIPLELWPYFLDTEIAYHAFAEEGIFEKPVWLPAGMEEHFGEKAFIKRMQTIASFQEQLQEIP